MNVDPEALARIMFMARIRDCEMTIQDAICATGEDHSQYMDLAVHIAGFINEYDVEARAVAKYILDRVNRSDIEAISWPPSRILP